MNKTTRAKLQHIIEAAMTAGISMKNLTRIIEAINDEIGIKKMTKRTTKKGNK